MTTRQELAERAAWCTRCDLYQRATATVFGEDRKNAAMMLVGEQPGGQEDEQGPPFVGPAGEIATGTRQREPPSIRWPPDSNGIRSSIWPVTRMAG